MKISNLTALLAAFFCLLMAASCSGDEFTVKGTVAGAPDKCVAIEKPDMLGNWVVMDSLRTGADGAFKFRVPSPAAPEIYRLRLDGRFLYLPVEGGETLKVETSLKDFGTRYTLSGSELAERMARFDLDANALDPSDAKALDAFKRRTYAEIIQPGKGDILSYYVLTKQLADRPLFDAADPEDAKYFAAVATQYQQFNPSDPHAKMLERSALEALRNRPNARETVLEAREVNILDIDLPGTDGKNVRLSDVVGKGKPVAVIFSLMRHPDSPEVNRQLAEAYYELEGRAEFYQVSFDEDRYKWREAARNLPWINVYDPAGDNSDLLVTYNVGRLPAVIVYDAEGSIAERVDNLATLAQSLRRHS